VRNTKTDLALISTAMEKLIARRSSYSKTSCAVLTCCGNTYSAVNIKIHNSAPCSVCAEQIAIGYAVSQGITQMKTIVAIANWTGTARIILPCGMCKEFIKQFGNPYIITSMTTKTKLSNL